MQLLHIGNIGMFINLHICSYCIVMPSQTRSFALQYQQRDEERPAPFPVELGRFFIMEVL